MIRRLVVTGFVLTLTLVAALIVPFTLHFGIGGNWGLEVGYYGQFNRVESVISQSTPYAITGSWLHEDISLEDFTFTLSDATGRQFDLDFAESELKLMPSNEGDLVTYVKNKIEAQLREKKGDGEKKGDAAH